MEFSPIRGRRLAAYAVALALGVAAVSPPAATLAQGMAPVASPAALIPAGAIPPEKLHLERMHESKKSTPTSFTDDWKFHPDYWASHGKADGSASLTVDHDGTWSFSGQLSSLPANEKKLADKYHGKIRFTIVMATKSKQGGVFYFTQEDYWGTDGLTWQKQGKSQVIADNFSAFASGHHWTGEYRYKLVDKHEPKKKEPECKNHRTTLPILSSNGDQVLPAGQPCDISPPSQQSSSSGSGGGGGGGGSSSVWSTVGDVAAGVGTALLALL